MPDLWKRTFLSLYLEHCGVSEVPERFHLWSGLALLAACLQERVWFERFKSAPLVPNLYVVLVAKSGVGKGRAISEAVKFLRDEPRARMYNGAITGPALLKRLSTGDGIMGDEAKASAGKTFLVTPELSQQVGSGGVAIDFIKTVTQLWDGGEVAFKKSTMYAGNFNVQNYCVNWLGGSTSDWLGDSLDERAVASGAWARIVAVQERFDDRVRVRNPVYPPNYDEIRDHLEARIHMLLQPRMRGVFRLDPDADRIAEQWYNERSVPSEPELLPIYLREYALVLKLSMLLAVSANEAKWLIRPSYILRAQTMVSDLRRESLELIHELTARSDKQGSEYVYRGIVEARRLTRTASLKRALTKGIWLKRHDEIIEHLVQARKIETSRTGKQGIVYHTVGEARMPRELQGLRTLSKPGL